MHEILIKENLKSALLRGIQVKVTCEGGHTCCVRGNMLHDETTGKYTYCDGGFLFRNTLHLENNWCVTTAGGAYRFFTETPVHSIILKRKQL